MALTPLHDRVLVKRTESEEKTSGGLIIPDSAKEKPSEGEVVSVGEGARKDSGELIAPAVRYRSNCRRRRNADDERKRHHGDPVLIKGQAGDTPTIYRKTSN